MLAVAAVGTPVAWDGPSVRKVTTEQQGERRLLQLKRVNKGGTVSSAHHF